MRRYQILPAGGCPVNIPHTDDSHKVRGRRTRPQRRDNAFSPHPSPERSVHRLPSDFHPARTAGLPDTDSRHSYNLDAHSPAAASMTVPEFHPSPFPPDLPCNRSHNNGTSRFRSAAYIRPHSPEYNMPAAFPCFLTDVSGLRTFACHPSPFLNALRFYPCISGISLH